MMPRDDDEPPIVRIYTVCDESRYLVVRNVPALGCGEELSKLFGSYGEIEECKPMDAEDCEPFTDVYWIKFSKASNARFAKRKLDDSVFFGNHLQVSYAPEYESLSDTQDKLEGRRIEVLARIKYPRQDGTTAWTKSKRREQEGSTRQHLNHVPSNQDYFPSPSMNQTVKLVREKLDMIESSSEHKPCPAAKKARLDDRRRI
ncbi:hypothetical protein HPP92_004102 [Vanilla planifolia]|uniref:RNA-binding protein 48 n=1 Tax=Vanilla planifolia TaxID=51239 RepID=A0A835SBM8_VANPL|nr:hypothetical protein HPP92_004102 [Vanilla planifolia]